MSFVMFAVFQGIFISVREESNEKEKEKSQHI